MHISVSSAKLNSSWILNLNHKPEVPTLFDVEKCSLPPGNEKIPLGQELMAMWMGGGQQNVMLM